MIVTKKLKFFILLVLAYELSLAANILLVTVMSPIMILEAYQSDVTGLSVLIGIIVMFLAWIASPLSIITNIITLFTSKLEIPKWYIYIIPAPFLVLLILSLFMMSIKPFIPFSLG